MIALVLALVAMLAHYTHASVPMIASSHVFDALAIAYVVLMIGVLFRDLAVVRSTPSSAPAGPRSD